MTDWVFGYGSLMWDAGFQPLERVRARLDGWHRSFCLRSIEHRGRPERPGLVLGLDADPGATCRGLALRMPPDERDAILTALRARELVTDAYRETLVNVTLEDGREVEAVTFVMKRDHWQYAGGLPLDEQAAIIAAASGGRGPNADYLFNTAAHLAEIELRDAEMERLADLVRAHLAAS